VPVTSRDRGAAALVKRLTGAKGASVDVGILGERASTRYEDGITVAMVAEWAELGLGQPMRSWLRGWVDENAAEIDRRIAAEVARFARGQGSQRQALERLAAWMVGGVQARIARGIDPPNAQSTIDRKGSSKPLIDKGQLRSSVASRVNGGG
jgi:hypothetical protein